MYESSILSSIGYCRKVLTKYGVGISRKCCFPHGPPRANRCSDQVHGLAALRQPLAKNEAVQRTQNQPFGAARGTRYDANVFRPQSVFTDVGQSLGACVDLKGLHGVYFFKPCSLAKALAMAEPAAAGGEE